MGHYLNFSNGILKDCNFIDVFQINQWCEEAGGNITINFHIRDPNGAASIIDDRNPFWTAFKNATDEL